MEFFIGETEPFDRARTIVLDHHIHMRNEPAYDVTPFLCLQIYAQALFAYIMLNEIAAAAFFQNTIETGRVSFRGLFDFDDLSPHFGQQARRRRSGNNLCKVQHLIAS